jgi:uncharacterized membrane protein YkvA (DUF1232 family)
MRPHGEKLRSSVSNHLQPPFSMTIFSAMIFQDAIFWNRSDAAGDETLVRRSFWRKCQRVAARLPFAEDLLAAYYCAFDRATPLHVKTALVATLAYFVMPADLVPDFLPALGYVDDAASLAATMRLVAAHILPAHRDAAAEALARLSAER